MLFTAFLPEFADARQYSRYNQSHAALRHGVFRRLRMPSWPRTLAGST